MASYCKCGLVAEVRVYSLHRIRNMCSRCFRQWRKYQDYEEVL